MALSTLAQHRTQGHPLVLLSNTSGYIAAAASECWQLDFWLANVIPVDELGKITGVMDHAAVFRSGQGGQGRAAGRDEHGVSLENSYFYSDSLSDLPMLQRVGHPYVVNPDPKLRSVARTRGWPVLDWSRR